MWSSVVAVLGTLAGAALAGYVQRSGDRRARDHAHRQEVARAVAELLEAIVRHREVHWLAVESRRAGAGEVEEEHTARATTRNAATVARDRLGLPIWGVSASLGSVWVASGGDLRLDDVTVRGGDSPGDGGGILVEAGGKLNLEDVTLLDNTAAVRGGGVAVLQGATGVITRGWFKFNNADSGGGLQADGTVRADGPEFTRNHARRFGGAIDHDFGDSVFKRTTATGNTAGLDGGGVDIDLGTIEFVDSKIRDNTSAGTRGGGIFNGATLKLTSTEVSGNVIGGVGGRGGGIYNASGPSTLVLKGSTVERNSANGSGTSQGGGIYNNGGSVTLDHSTVRGNASTVAPGGVFTVNQFTVIRSTIRDNIPTNCAGSPVIVMGCVD
ncbi:hypothetical protein OG350_29860 [Streptomyces achromogenes]|uniref:Right handed beta helix domain-containing protein n=1 Tax=Streptomyces achromogenes TaxID=67255 RepID=A0ABZ1KZE0_STRAH